uniref:CCHC-type domain-containing protein n=1 Tax=Megaselia scalaris TaxID=36166 RepID=T1GW04_MEGSC
MPRIKQCFKCQRFGHLAVNCKSSADICAQCGQNHQSNNCRSNCIKCPNCGENHPSTSKDCSARAEYAEIQRIMITHNLNFLEAKNRLRPQFQLDPIHFPPLTKGFFKAAIAPSAPGPADAPITVAQQVQLSSKPKPNKRNKNKPKTKKALSPSVTEITETKDEEPFEGFEEETMEEQSAESDIEFDDVSTSSKRQRLSEAIKDKREQEMNNKSINSSFELNT